MHQTSEHLTGQKIVLGFEKYFDGIQYLDISPKKSGHGYISRYIVSCDIVWYGTWSRDISPYIMRYHTGSPRNNGHVPIERNPTTSSQSTLTLVGLVPSLILACKAVFVFLLLSISWTHHRADRTTKPQRFPLRTRRSPWAHDVCTCFISHLSF